MSDAAPQRVRYQPSINVAQAPPLGVPLLYVAAAYGFLVVAAVLAVVNAPWLARGDYASPRVVVVVHLVTLGFLSMTAMGLLHQWVPVVLDVPARPMRRAVWGFAGYAVAVVGFAWGIAHQQGMVLAVSGSLLAAAIVWWSAGVLTQLAHSTKPRDRVYWGLAAAVLGFNATWVLGLLLALSLLAGWSGGPVLPVHIATALVGWLGILVLTVQLKLTPMFALSKPTPAQSRTLGLPLGLAGAGVLLAWVSLKTSSTVESVGAGLWTAAVLLSIIQSVNVIRRGKSPRFDRVFVGVAAAWGLLLAAAIASLWLAPLAVVLAFWGLITLIFSYQARIVPFIVAVSAARRLTGPPVRAFYLAQALQAANQPVVTAILGCAGAALAVLGQALGSPGCDAASGLALLSLIAWQVGGVTAALARGRTGAGGPRQRALADPEEGRDGAL